LGPTQTDDDQPSRCLCKPEVTGSIPVAPWPNQAVSGE